MNGRHLHDRVIDVLNGDEGLAGLLWLNDHLALIHHGEYEDGYHVGLRPPDLVEIVRDHNFADPVQVSRLVEMLVHYWDLWRERNELDNHVRRLRESLGELSEMATTAQRQRWTVRLDRDCSCSNDGRLPPGASSAA